MKSNRHAALASHFTESNSILHTRDISKPLLHYTVAPLAPKSSRDMQIRVEGPITEPMRDIKTIPVKGTMVGGRSPSPDHSLDMSLSHKSTMSFQTLISEKKGSLSIPGSPQPIKAYPVTQFPAIPTSLAEDEVAILRTKIELLDHKLEELRATVEVFPSSISIISDIEILKIDITMAQ